MQICMDLRHSKRVFGLSALTGYLVVVGLLLLFRAPLEVILWGLGPPRDFDIQTHSRLAAPSPATAVRSQGDPASGRDHSLVIVALSVLLAYDWRGNPPRFLPNAGGLMLSAVALGFIVFVASWSASRPSRACPECGGRIPPSGRIAKCPYCGHALS